MNFTGFPRFRTMVGTGLFALSILLFSAPAKGLETRYQKDVRPILETLCFECHDADTQKGDIRLDTLGGGLTDASNATAWHDVLDQLSLGEMPPKKSTQPTSEQRRILTTWIGDALREAASAQRFADGRVVMRRLTRYEYANTMRDLLGIEYDFARELPPEPASPEGFLNNGLTLEMSSTQVETYLATARKALAIAIPGGGKPKVFKYDIEKTSVGKLPRKKDGGAIPVNPEFVLDIPEFPREGAFQLTIQAGAIVPEGHDVPRMRVALGCVPGIIHVPRKLVGEVDVTATPDSPQTFTFRGRMEDYPQAGERKFGSAVAFHGVIALIDFLDADGNELRYRDRWYSDPVPKPKKGQKKAPQPPTGKPPPEGPRLDIVIDSVTFEAPVVTSWPPESQARWFSAAVPDAPESVKTRQILEPFMTRAFRRPITPAELNQSLQLFSQIRPRVDSFEAAMRETMASVLVSPHFLYRVETRNGNGSERLDAYELASRLSYFLWSTLPDDRLISLAAEGSLLEPGTLEGEIRRMLDDPRTREFTDRFADQWFDLAGLERVAVNPEFYPDFDNDLKESMQDETRGVFREILLGDLSCLELIDANWTLANRSLAKHYGLAQIPRTSALERVALRPEDRRGGVLGQGAFLLANSNGETAHPIKRAVWILDRLIDSPPAPPPPDVPELDSESPDLAGLTVKEQLAVHREKESCRECHRGIDPWGIPLQHFDAVGNWRTHAPVRIGGKAESARVGAPIDAMAELPNGTPLSGVGDMKRFLIDERREWIARSIVKRLSAYALGRSLDLGDREAVEMLTAEFNANDLRLRDLIVSLVKSDLFLTK